MKKKNSRITASASARTEVYDIGNEYKEHTTLDVSVIVKFDCGDHSNALDLLKKTVEEVVRQIDEVSFMSEDKNA